MLTGKVTDKRMHYVQVLYRLCDYLINCESYSYWHMYTNIISNNTLNTIITGTNNTLSKATPPAKEGNIYIHDACKQYLCGHYEFYGCLRGHSI